ncbi:hypothetical protein WN944_022666 [Citrus x changshan-huyou]|uniref:Uncharacterized protein n=1 Tax=Citrus x changshan-huyou TaxID=2935761 RepID=A0AAP0N1V8_9ROSI
MMSAAALFLTVLAFLAIAAQARTLSSDDSWHNKISMAIEYGRAVKSPPPSPKSSPPTKHITSVNGNYEPSVSESQLSATNSPDNGKIKKRSPPPPPASSISPTQSENTASPFSTMITMVTHDDQDYGRTRSSPPPSPKPAPPTQYDLSITNEQLNHLLGLFI